MKETIRNFWYYHKLHVIIALTVLLAGSYLFTQKETVKPDYDAAVISPAGCTEQQLQMLKAALEQAGEDRTEDGQVSVRIHVYRLTVGADGQNANEIAALDADLVGKVSGLFITGDPTSLEKATNGLLKAADAIPIGTVSRLSECGMEEMFLMLRHDVDEKYAVICAALTA